MYARTKPDDEITERSISSVVFSQNGETIIHTPEGEVYAKEFGRCDDYGSFRNIAKPNF